MKRELVFILIFFLVFFINFRLVNALTTGECRHYENGICQNIISIQSPSGASVEQPQQPEVPMQLQQTSQLPTFMILIFQLIGIIVLFTLLFLVVQELVKSQNKKVRKKKK